MFLIKKFLLLVKEKLLDVTDFAALGFNYNSNGCNLQKHVFSLEWFDIFRSSRSSLASKKLL